jgi:hypothetical protein
MASKLKPVDIMDSDASTSIEEEEEDSTSSESPPGSPMNQDSLTLESFTENTKATVIPKTHIPMIPGSKRGPKLGPGVWLSVGIPREYLVNGIPIAGVINEHGIHRPSPRGPGIWPSEDTIV